jgi:hypothetical protein
MGEMTSGFGYRIPAAILIIAVLVPVALAAEVDNDSRFPPVFTNPELVQINNSAMNETALQPFSKEPEPVTVFKAEVRDTALPGPRYMAFGPSVIGISISPVIISALVVLLFLGIAAWCIRNGIGRDENKQK